MSYKFFRFYVTEYVFWQDNEHNNTTHNDKALYIFIWNESEKFQTVLWKNYPPNKFNAEEVYKNR